MEKLITVAGDILQKLETQKSVEQVVEILTRMDKRLSHIEDWMGQIDSEIKRVTRRP